MKCLFSSVFSTRVWTLKTVNGVNSQKGIRLIILSTDYPHLCWLPLFSHSPVFWSQSLRVYKRVAISVNSHSDWIHPPSPFFIPHHSREPSRAALHRALEAAAGRRNQQKSSLCTPPIFSSLGFNPSIIYLYRYIKTMRKIILQVNSTASKVSWCIHRVLKQVYRSTGGLLVIS